MERFTQRNDFLSAAELTVLQDFFQSQVLWTYGWQSDIEKTPFGHWNHDFLRTARGNQDDCQSVLLNNPALAPLHGLWKRLREEILPGHLLVRCYANAHTFGVEGYPHVDSRAPGNYTTVIYVNPVWKAEWAGETVFLNDLGDIFRAVLPKPGRIVTFDGRILHAARGLSRTCPAMRATLMFKTRVPGHDAV